MDAATAMSGITPGQYMTAFYFRLRFRIMEVMSQTKQLSVTSGINRLYVLYGLLFVVYFTLIYFTNPAQAILQDFHYSETTTRWLGLVSRVPLVLIWFAAFYGYIQFKGYVQAIEGGSDRQELKYISSGLAVLTIGLPLTYVVGNALLFAVQHGVIESSHRVALSNYPALIMQLGAFALISRGAYGLTKTVKQQTNFFIITLYGLLAIVIGVIYSFLVAANDVRLVEAPGMFNPVYQLPNWAVVVAVVLPFLFAWSLGIRAVFDLSRFQNLVNGRIYRHSLKMITGGIGLVVSASIIIQFITTQTKQSLLGSTPRMFFIAYLLYAVFAVGYILIASGARRLRKIEEV